MLNKKTSSFLRSQFRAFLMAIMMPGISIIAISTKQVRKLQQLATLKRSVELITSFPQEQRNPPAFYVPLARDTLSLMQCFTEILRPPRCAGERAPIVCDVGAGPGFFAQVFTQAGMTYISIDPAGGDYSHPPVGIDDPTSVSSVHNSTHIKASGYQLPLKDDSCDVVLCSNVAEHVARPWQLADELMRIVRPGGLLFMSYTIWFGPFGGHETGLWHYCGGRFAARRYYRMHGKWPKNLYGSSLFRVDAADGISWARRWCDRGGGDIVALFPRYHPWWSWWIIAVPGIRELLTSNLMIVVRKAAPHVDEQQG